MNKMKKIWIVALWLCIWQLAAVIVDNDILLAGPVEVGGTLLQLVMQAEFYRVCATTLGRILLGFLSAFILGVFLGMLCYRFPVIKDLTGPVLSVIKSIPVASFVVLLLIWQGSANLSVWISFLVVFPNACVSTENGLKAVDKRMVEMADVFGIYGFRRILYIYRPTVLAYLVSAMEVSIGLAFKSGVAAEVIGTPEFSIGEKIYMSKVYLDTAGLFAWTLALVVLSFVIEKIILRLLKMCQMPVPVKTVLKSTNRTKNVSGRETKPADEEKTELYHVSKRFGDKKVLSDLSKEISNGECVLLMGESGIGKTTVLRLFAGLESPEEGRVTAGRASYMFQEDRLLEEEYVLTNIMLGANTEIIAELASEILPEDCLYKKAAGLSGGMKRRVALLRTLVYRMNDVHTILLLDEPFAGLDDGTKKKTADFINKYRNNRTMIVATHDAKDAELLGGNIWNIQKYQQELL